MASAAKTKMAAIVIMLAILFVGIASATPAPPEPECIDKTADVPGNACICSKNCACAGMCILDKGAYPTVTDCFVNCVLKNDCKCPPSSPSGKAPEEN